MEEGREWLRLRISQGDGGLRCRPVAEEDGPRDDDDGHEHGDDGGDALDARSWLRGAGWDEADNDEIGDGARGELRQDTNHRTPQVGVVGVEGEASTPQQRRESHEPGEDEHRCGHPLVQGEEHEHEKGEDQVGQPLHGQGPGDDVPAPVRMWPPLLDEQDVAQIVPNSEPGTILRDSGDPCLRHDGDPGDVEHDEVHGINTRQTQPPELHRRPDGKARAQPPEIGVRDDEARQCEEKIHAQAPDTDDVAQDGDIHDADAVEWILEVIEQDPEGGYESDAGELSDENRHAPPLAAQPLTPHRATRTPRLPSPHARHRSPESGTGAGTGGSPGGAAYE